MSLIQIFITNNFIKDKIYIFVIFLIMCLAFSIPFGHQYGRKIIVVIFVLWIFIVEKDNLLKILTHRFLIAFLLLIFIYYISLFWSDNIPKGLHYIQTILIYWFGPLVVFSTIIKKEHIKYIVAGFLAGMFINEIISYLIYFDLYDTAYSKLHPGHPVGFIYHITYSVLMAFSALLILYQANHMKNIYVKMVYLVFFLTMTINLIISGGRTGYIVFFASLIVLLIIYYKVSLKNFLLTLVFPILIFTVVYKIDSGIQTRVNAAFTDVQKVINDNNYNTSVGTRIAFYPMSYEMLSQAHNGFFFGVGTGDIPQEMAESINRTNIVKVKHSHTHNSYMETYLNTGIIGLILLLLMFYYLWKIDIKDKNIKFIQQLILINIMVAMTSDRILEITPTMFFFALFSSIVLAQERQEHKVIQND